MRRSFKQAVSAPVLLVIAVFVLPGAGSFTETEFRCEEAAGTLEDCCPDLDIKALSCARETGCAGETTRPPVLAVSESDCIDGLSCEELAAAGVCERVDARQLRFSQDDPDPFVDGVVCP